MTNEQINIAIAEACGWQVHPRDRFIVIPPNSPHSVQPLYTIPNYCNDLNAMHEAEKMLNDEQHRQYRSEVWYSVCNDISSYECVKAAERPHFSATSHQRAEAFLKTLGKWEGAK
jgi:hypothetical protein